MQLLNTKTTTVKNLRGVSFFTNPPGDVMAASSSFYRHIESSTARSVSPLCTEEEGVAVFCHSDSRAQTTPHV